MSVLTSLMGRIQRVFAWHQTRMFSKVHMLILNICNNFQYFFICQKDCFLTHWGRVTHICVNEFSHHWFRYYQNQCWLIVNWTPRNKSQWTMNLSVNIFTEGNAYENVVCEMLAILSWLQCVNSLDPGRFDKNLEINNFWM